MDVALATCLDLPEPDHDAPPLEAALRAAGIDARWRAWDDPRADWSAARMTVLRATWNYPVEPDRFLAWAERVATVSHLCNPLPLVRWNLSKRYLLDLERRGVPIVPTALVTRGSVISLRDIRAERGWDDVVVKPAVSAASYRTMRVGPCDLDAGEAHYRALVTDRDVLVQGYLPTVETHGERALVWIDGQLTHAVRKSPRFSGQAEAVSAESVPVSAAEAALAHRAIAMVDPTPLYARVDAAPGPDGAPVLMELELIEPSLFFPQEPRALARFVRALERELRGLPPGGRPRGGS
jgi:hypothetical protein